MSPSTPVGAAIHRHSWSTAPGPAGARAATAGSFDETYLKVLGEWRYPYRAVDQFRQVIDAMLSERRDGSAPRRFFEAGSRPDAGWACAGWSCQQGASDHSRLR